MREIAVFGGSAHPELAAEICGHLEVPLLPSKLQRFANDCLGVQLAANCRERDVFVVQPLVPPVQENAFELFLMLDAARGASASRITAVLPHYAYARSDKKDAPRISIGGRLVADLLVAAGANRVLTMTLHSPQVHGFFSVPVDHLHALRQLAQYFRQYDLSNVVVVSPDLGNAKQATRFARLLGTTVAAGAKQRFSDDRVSISSIIGEVADRDIIVLDDEIAKGSTVLELLDRLRQPKGQIDQDRMHARTFLRWCTPALKRSTRCDRDRLHEYGPNRTGQKSTKAECAVRSAHAGRRHTPHSQR